MHRFILPGKLVVGTSVLDDREVVHQIKDVLRLQKNEKIIICDGVGSEAEAEILELNRKGIAIHVASIRKNGEEPKREVTLYCAVLKLENFEWVVQKATEVGVKKIVPVVTAHTVKTALNLSRLKKIVKEAAEQSGRGIVPEIYAPVEFTKAVAGMSSKQLNLFCHFNGDQMLQLKVKDEALSIWVGPEGGWSEGEVELVGERDFKMVALGSTVLRGETAAVVGAWLAINL